MATGRENDNPSQFAKELESCVTTSLRPNWSDAAAATRARPGCFTTKRRLTTCYIHNAVPREVNIPLPLMSPEVR